ncbi:hypothetical protein Taro_030246 [Colocasia esculenta]|uniref:Vps41 C-terminal RING finger domain-containing protein n=1 Tax=Colocasia esculenta TaxID=4460 RepID=A0A843VNL4_COLES|nr:hypothetical protein [Colocasia esculenta]
MHQTLLLRREAMKQVSSKPPPTRRILRERGGIGDSCLVELYADYEPQMLLPFLRSSQHYRLDKIGVLLEHTVGNLDPLYIVRMVPDGLRIPRLRDHLVKIITDYRTETSLRHGCNDILKADCVNLLVKYYKEARHAVYLGSEEETLEKRGRSTSAHMTERVASVRNMEVKSRTKGGGRCCLCFDPFSIQDVSVVVFFCCHAYHVPCLMGGSDSIGDMNNESDDDDDTEAGGSRLRCVLCTNAAVG